MNLMNNKCYLLLWYTKGLTDKCSNTICFMCTHHATYDHYTGIASMDHMAKNLAAL